MQVRTENNGKDGKSGESPLFNLVFPLPTVHLSHQPTFRAFSLRALVYTVTFTCQFLREIFPDYTQLGRAVIIIATYYFILQNLFSLFPSFLFVPFTSLEVICNLTPYFLQFVGLFLVSFSVPLVNMSVLKTIQYQLYYYFFIARLAFRQCMLFF